MQVVGVPSLGSAQLSFTAPTGATSVKVQQSTDNGVTWTDSETQDTLTAASTSVRVTGLINGTSYSLRVVVEGGAYAGSSNVVIVRPVYDI